MMETQTTKKTYNEKICQYCGNRDMCDRNRFTVKEINEKRTIICHAYEYERK